MLKGGPQVEEWRLGRIMKSAKTANQRLFFFFKENKCYDLDLQHIYNAITLELSSK